MKYVKRFSVWAPENKEMCILLNALRGANVKPTVPLTSLLNLNPANRVKLHPDVRTQSNLKAVQSRIKEQTVTSERRKPEIKERNSRNFIKLNVLRAGNTKAKARHH